MLPAKASGTACSGLRTDLWTAAGRGGEDARKPRRARMSSSLKGHRAWKLGRNEGGRCEWPGPPARGGTGPPMVLWSQEGAGAPPATSR